MKLLDILLEEIPSETEVANSNDAPADGGNNNTTPRKVQVEKYSPVQSLGRKNFGFFIAEKGSYGAKYIDGFATKEEAVQARKNLISAVTQYSDYAKQGRVKTNGPSFRTKALTLDELTKKRLRNGGIGSKAVAGMLSNSFFVGRFGVFKMFTALGLTAGALYGIAGAIEDNWVEVSNGSMSEEEAQSKEDILWGMFGVELLLIYRIIFSRAGYLKKAIRYIRNMVRVGQAAVGLTGVGAIPSLISFIISEAGFLVLGVALNSSQLQSAAADWLHEFTLAQLLIGGLGKGVQMAGATLQSIMPAWMDALLPDSLQKSDRAGFEQIERGGREGDMYASAEWAKLVFANLIFPEGTKAQIVPYIPYERREQLLDKVMEDSEIIQRAEQEPAPQTEPTPA